MVKKKEQQKTQKQLLKDFQKAGLGVAEMVSIKDAYKTMGMIMTEPFMINRWLGTAYGNGYCVTVKLLVSYGEPSSTVMDYPIERVKKFRPWAYFHKPKPEKKQKESVAKPEQDVVQ
jgi:hypothetical protein